MKKRQQRTERPPRTKKKETAGRPDHEFFFLPSVVFAVVLVPFSRGGIFAGGGPPILFQKNGKNTRPPRQSQI
ncbi:hypothetical protein CWI49_11330, partial [Neisseria meningitidis]|uniref:hypothetical protein n=1 Tax=Neisseria meningitidis TaxID=487 RepID=UPI000CC04767